MTAPDPDRFETIAFVYGQPELAALLSLLEHEDIWVSPVGRGHISVDWTITVALGGVELRVHAADAARARALLAQADDRQIWRGFLLRNRLLDIALMLLLLAAGVLAPPARLPAWFVGVPARRDA
jgi:hypothetical protein